MRTAIVVFDEAQILDIAGPMEMLRGASLAVRDKTATRAPAYETQIVAHDKGTVRTSCGLQIVATDSFDSARQDIDTLIVAGGVMDAALKDKRLLKFVRDTALVQVIDRFQAVFSKGPPTRALFP